MFTIKELEDKRTEYESACYLTIRQLLSKRTGKLIEFDLDNIEECAYCIGDNCMGIIDGVIKEIYINPINDAIEVTYADSKDYSCTYSENIKFLVHCDLIDIIETIKNKLKNGKTNLGEEA